MVKSNPKVPDRQTRRRLKFMQMLKQKPMKTLLLHSKLLTYNSTSSSCDQNLHLHQQSTFSNSKTTQSPLTPPPLKNKKHSRSPSYTSSTYGTCSSSSPPPSPSSLSSPPPMPSFLDPKSPQFCLLHCNLSSEPQSLSSAATAHPHLLRRSFSDPPVFYSDSSPDHSSNSKKMRTMKQELSQSPSVSRNLMNLLPPLPPPPSPKLLRRTVSDPVPLVSDTSTSKEKMKEQIVKAEKLSKDWTMIKLKCGCGSNLHFLLSAADNRCYKLV